MQNYKYVMVSIFSFLSKFCNKELSVIVVLLLTSLTPTVNSVITSALSYGGLRSRFTPIPSTLKAVLNNNSGNIPFPDNDPTFLSASIHTNLQPTFSPANWNNISRMGLQQEGLESTFAYFTDNLHHHNDNILNIYGYTILLLLRRIESWLKSNGNLNDIEHYLGFDIQTINVINLAMTELISTKRNFKVADSTIIISTNSIESLFYYACDIKRMQQNEDTVKQNFYYFIEMFRYPIQEIGKANEVQIEKMLRLILSAFVDKTVHPPIKVSIESMKMTILSEPTDNYLINKIKDRPVYSGTHTTIQELVESYATESDGIRVNAYHVCILSVLIPDIFGYVYNHFELLYKLQDYEINEYDKIVIGNFSRFMSSFISIFVNRFFEFKGQLSQELHDAMYAVELFLDPSETHTEYKRLSYNEGPSRVRDPYLFHLYDANMTINSYYNIAQRKVVIGYMRLMMNDALQKLLVTCTRETPATWNTKRFSKIQYQEYSEDKDTLILLLSVNNDSAFEILSTFNSIFIH